MIYHDDNGASLQPQDAEREGAFAFSRAVFVSYCIAGASLAVAVGAIGALMGAW